MASCHQRDSDHLCRLEEITEIYAPVPWLAMAEVRDAACGGQAEPEVLGSLTLALGLRH